MSKAYKIVVTGPFNAGKTEFIRSVSIIPIVSTERRISDDLAEVKETTTVAMDYGQVTVGDRLFHLYGTPGQERFDFMWDILAREMDGFLVLVDSTDRSSLAVARRILRRLGRKRRVPSLVIATRQGKRRAMPPERLAKTLRIKHPDTVIPCDPRDGSGSREVLEQLLSYLE